MIAWDNSYSRLSPKFFRRQVAETVTAPALIAWNEALADELGLTGLADDPADLANIFSGNRTLPGSEPIALAYAAHQFGSFVPQLGDGRALLLGEVIDRNGRRRDIQLKGSGQTAFSRRGDGRAALGPVLREYLVSEAMHALGVPTTRALAAVLTGDPVYRETVLPGAVLTRVAASHIRIGTFQYFAAREDIDGLRELLDHAISRHDPALADRPDRALAFLEAVMARQAELVARWMGLGFIHGVMNTDNMTVSGETIDYGPCAFLDLYEPTKVFSSIDRGGRYAYRNQPAVAQWNLARLAECLLPLIDDDGDTAVTLATAKLNGFADLYDAAWRRVITAKFALASQRPEDGKLMDWWLNLMHQGGADFTRAFRQLYRIAAGTAGADALAAEFAQPVDLAPFLDAWTARRALEIDDGKDEARLLAAMRLANPALIARNHLVEKAIREATGGDFTFFHRLAAAWRNPGEDPAEDEDLARPPQPEEEVSVTFCGT